MLLEMVNFRCSQGCQNFDSPGCRHAAGTSGLAWRGGLGREGTAHRTIGPQHLDAGQGFGLKAHESATVGRGRQVGDLEVAALPAVGRLFRPRQWAGRVWHGGLAAVGPDHRRANPARWPCRGGHALARPTWAAPGSRRQPLNCRTRGQKQGSTWQAWSKRCAMQADTRP